MRAFVLLLMLMPALGLAEQQPWMKKENPDELFASVLVDPSCPVSIEQANEVVGDELVRSRINPKANLDRASLPTLALYVVILCMEDQRQPNWYHVSMSFDFATQVQLIDSDTPYVQDVRLGVKPFASYQLVANKEFLESSLRSYVAPVIADYLRANFDLGD